MVPLSRANTWKRREEGGGDNSFRGADKLDFLGASVVAERRACKGLETRGILLSLRLRRRHLWGNSGQGWFSCSVCALRETIPPPRNVDIRYPPNVALNLDRDSKRGIIPFPASEDCFLVMWRNLGIWTVPEIILFCSFFFKNLKKKSIVISDYVSIC